MSPKPFVWVITGCSYVGILVSPPFIIIHRLYRTHEFRSGIGRELTLAALERGDKVIATTRAQSFDAIKDLKAFGADIFELDVTAHIDELRKIAAEAVKIYGHVDVVMNNAGKFFLSQRKSYAHCDIKVSPYVEVWKK